MTTYAKVKQTLVSLEGAKATMDMIGQISWEDQSRKTFSRNAEKLHVVIERLKKRVQIMEFEEPDYKGF